VFEVPAEYRALYQLLGGTPPSLQNSIFDVTSCVLQNVLSDERLVKFSTKRPFISSKAGKKREVERELQHNLGLVWLNGRTTQTDRGSYLFSFCLSTSRLGSCNTTTHTSDSIPLMRTSRKWTSGAATLLLEHRLYVSLVLPTSLGLERMPVDTRCSVLEQTCID
jgi:hypothetical protein